MSRDLFRHFRPLVCSNPFRIYTPVKALGRWPEAASRLSKVSACTAGFLPPGRDVFPGNHWKVQGTVLGFARAHPPRSLGYVNGRCANGTDSAVEAYLREFS